MESIRRDVAQLYRYWMSLLYPRQRSPHPVLGHYEPTALPDRVLFYLWGTLGFIMSIIVMYPIAVIGLGFKRGVSMVVAKADEFGVWETLLLLGLVWTFLISTVTHLHGIQSGLAVTIASCIALLTTFSAFIARDYGTDTLTILVAYPSAYTALFLPPITAAVISPYLGDALLYYSIITAEEILTTIAAPLGLSEWFRTTFTLDGVYHIFMWMGISLIGGWFTGVAVTLARKMKSESD